MRFFNNKMWVVYKHIFPNGKIYVGITGQKPYKRWKYGHGYSSDLITKAIKKYGWGNIKHEILFDGLTKEQAEQKEIELIAFYKSNDPNYGYNLATGGNVNCGYKLSEEKRRAISERQKGKRTRKVYIVTQEMKDKISKKLKGNKLSKETKRKMSDSRKDGKVWNSKAVINLDTNEVFASGRMAGIKYGINYKNINLVCKNKRHTAGGYHWAYFTAYA